MKRILCVCAGGNVRSATVAYLLKDMGFDALAVGLVMNSGETVAMLCEWADAIWIAEEEMLQQLPRSARDKLVNSPIDYTGPDVWGLVLHRDLQNIASGIASRVGRKLTEAKAG